MRLVSAEFVTSGVGTGGIPRDGLPQIALVGRSNVGKSSLINALCRRPIARTSAAPGKTRLANVYRVTMLGGPAGPGRHSLYLVDLPGYGYARGGSEGASELRSVAEAYLTGGRAESRGQRAGSADWPQAGSPVPHAVLQLVDSRHPGLASDLAAAAWLDRLGLTRHVVATKIDKLSRTARARNLRTLEERLARAALPVSATSGEGLDELWTLIARQPTRT